MNDAKSAPRPPLTISIDICMYNCYVCRYFIIAVSDLKLITHVYAFTGQELFHDSVLQYLFTFKCAVPLVQPFLTNIRFETNISHLTINQLQNTQCS